jgi:hypothetical protein
MLNRLTYPEQLREATLVMLERCSALDTNWALRFALTQISDCRSLFRLNSMLLRTAPSWANRSVAANPVNALACSTTILLITGSAMLIGWHVTLLAATDSRF